MVFLYLAKTTCEANSLHIVLNYHWPDFHAM